MTTRFTVSLPDADVSILDEFIRERGLQGRSAGVRAAVHLLTNLGLEGDYAAAFAEDDGSDWDATAADTS